MSKNQFIPVEYRIASRIFGDRSYQVVSSEADFPGAVLEDIADVNRRIPVDCFMTVSPGFPGKKVIMVPFSGNEEHLELLLTAMDEVMTCCMGTPGFVFPEDVVSMDGQYACVLSGRMRDWGRPLRDLTPSVDGPRWEAAISLFQRVKELHDLGLTSNGFSREQLRYDPDSGEVVLRLNHTMCLQKDSKRDDVLCHRGFLAMPEATVLGCWNRGVSIGGYHRDIFSAAVAAFYMLTYGHPFTGRAFSNINRSDYLNYYHSVPMYVMDPDSENTLGNKALDDMTRERLEQMPSSLRRLFDELFLAVSRPQTHWFEKLSCWDVERWLRALREDKEKNDLESKRVKYNFAASVYHLV